jgi:hypothetical protein
MNQAFAIFGQPFIASAYHDGKATLFWNIREGKNLSNLIIYPGALIRRQNL